MSGIEWRKPRQRPRRGPRVYESILAELRERAARMWSSAISAGSASPWKASQIRRASSKTLIPMRWVALQRSSARRDELAIAPEHPDRAQRAEGGKLENVKGGNASRGTVRSDTDQAVHAVVHSEASKTSVGARQQATVEEGLARLERISLHACRHAYVSIMHDAALVSNASVTASATRART
jgi:hypothetical protein